MEATGMDTDTDKLTFDDVLKLGSVGLYSLMYEIVEKDMEHHAEKRYPNKLKGKHLLKLMDRRGVEK